ncbi:MAG: tetratricopeptide repeat protein [Kiritimatiellae bacterium]|nr:tetratricopeptide repeat protein [Kiritimatiellia bacterium]
MWWGIGCLVAALTLPVIVAVIGLLAAIAIPAFVKARDTAQENTYINNTRIAADPSIVYADVMNMLSTGKQKEAEEMLTVLVNTFPEDQPLAFVQAVCSRSRWAKSRAAWQFQRVMELNPSTVEGKCARYMLDLDARKMVEDNMNGLRTLIQQNPNNPLLLWLMGMECQDNFKLTGKKTYAKEGERCYRALLEQWDVGPVLLHQTYANILAEQLDLYEEALEHRRIAVKLEPAAWNYQGLANTLSAMKRYDEANAAYQKLINLDSTSARYWQNWAHSRSYAGDYEDCIEKCKQSAKADPTYVGAYRTWAWALHQQGELEEALDMYQMVIDMSPNDFTMYKNAISILKKLGRDDEAAKLVEERNKLPGW